RRDRGRSPVRQSPRRRNDRRLAGRAGVRGLEGLGLDREVGPLALLRRAVPAGAKPHRRRLRLCLGATTPRGDASVRPNGGTHPMPRFAARLLIGALAVGCVPSAAPSGGSPVAIGATPSPDPSV